MDRIAFALAAALLAAPALADDRVPPVTDTTVAKECGACHMAFQPALLPARSWERIMDGLSRHFGEDTSLPPAKQAAIRGYLVAHAGRGGGDGLRITELPWFVREHRLPDRVWKDPKVVTRSNCPACHQDAERGLYEDD